VEEEGSQKSGAIVWEGHGKMIRQGDVIKSYNN